MRGTATLSGKLERGLVAYAAAASAAGIGMLALPQPADAEVIYTPIRKIIASGDIYHLDFNRDGQTDFVLSNITHCGSTYCTFDLKVRPRYGGNAEVGTGFASALVKGSKISSQRQFYRRTALLARYYFGSGGYFSTGKWLNVTNRYLGLKFSINGETHYGWARLSVTVYPRFVEGKLTGYAYETIPDKPIIAGNRGRSIGARGPEAAPAGLGRLAVGAAGGKRQRGSPTSH